MKIKSIKLLNNFKRFQNLTIDLGDQHDRKVVALVGPNGSGKSSVFDGIMFLQHAYNQIGMGTGSRGAKYLTSSNDPAYSSKILENVIVEFDKGNYQSVFESKSQEGRDRTIVLFRSPYRFSQELDVKELKSQSPVINNDVGAGTTADLDQRVISNYNRLYGLYLEMIEDKDMRSSEAKREILGKFNAALEDVLGLSVSGMGNIPKGQGQLFFSKPDQKGAISFNVLSAGEKEVVDMLLEVFVKKDEFNDTIYLIDEPELHLNTGIQGKFLTALVNMVSDQCQVWIATHSLGFIRALQEDLAGQSLVIDFGSIDFSQPEIRLGPMQRTRSNWKRIFGNALADLSGLMAPKCIVYCEGKPEPGPNRSEQG